MLVAWKAAHIIPGGAPTLSTTEQSKRFAARVMIVIFLRDVIWCVFIRIRCNAIVVVVMKSPEIASLAESHFGRLTRDFEFSFRVSHLNIRVLVIANLRMFYLFYLKFGNIAAVLATGFVM